LRPRFRGPPGFLLSTPITACPVVLGRHVESLNFIGLMLADKAPLSSVRSFYQRILASDPDEVAFQAEALLKTIPLLQYYEEVALPALAMAQVDVTCWRRSVRSKFAILSSGSSQTFPPANSSAGGIQIRRIVPPRNIETRIVLIGLVPAKQVGTEEFPVRVH
jgi:hypothetical protein